MGQSGAARVDAEAVRAIAREYETAAQLVDSAVRNRLSGFGFGAATAGRAYAAHGDEIRDALAGVASALQQWSRAAHEIAAVLRSSVDRYQDADARAARRVG